MQTPSTNKTLTEHDIKIINALNAMPEDEREEATQFMDLLLIEKKSFQWLKENFVPTMKTGLKQRTAMVVDDAINAALSVPAK